MLEESITLRCRISQCD